MLKYKFNQNRKGPKINSMFTGNEDINYTHYLVLPLKAVACYDWFTNPDNNFKILFNYIYLVFVLVMLTSQIIALLLHLYMIWTNVMDNLELIADGFPFVTSILIIAYFASYKRELYDLLEFMQKEFRSHSPRGITNMTMEKSYKTAKNFAYFYTSCTFFSVSVYIVIPVIIYWLTKETSQHWSYANVNSVAGFISVCMRQCLSQFFVALSLGQLSNSLTLKPVFQNYYPVGISFSFKTFLNPVFNRPKPKRRGVFFASNSILLCGQLDLLCCSLRNARYTALLQNGVRHETLLSQFSDIQDDEMHNYLYNIAEPRDRNSFSVVHNTGNSLVFDIYDFKYDKGTYDALAECDRLYQTIIEYKRRFERFVSPLLVLRVVQVTLYLCTLLYAATSKFDMVTVEYLAAVAVDIFIYCYYGNQVTLQASRVSDAAYQSAWPAMGVRPRRMLLNIMLSSLPPVVIRAGYFLPMNLPTYVLIIKTSFSYYTLLVNVNEK